MRSSEIISTLNNVLMKSRSTENRITHAMISKVTGMTRESISRVLSGKRDVTLSNACAIADAIGCQIEISTSSDASDIECDLSDTLCDHSTHALIEALQGAFDHVKFLQGQILWIQNEMAELKKKPVNLNTSKTA